IPGVIIALVCLALFILLLKICHGSYGKKTYETLDKKYGAAKEQLELWDEYEKELKSIKPEQKNEESGKGGDE
ncbi:MAG: hypothetical protein IJC39_04995, partial [Firmicutes bacterium]|nr:hypothetical protein [Bacillota bacterium]